MKRLLTRSNRETGTVRELRLQVQRKQLEVKAAVEDLLTTAQVSH